MSTNDVTLMFTSHNNVEVFAHGLISVLGVLTKNEPVLIVKRTPYDELIVLTKHGIGIIHIDEAKSTYWYDDVYE